MDIEFLPPSHLPVPGPLPRCGVCGGLATRPYACPGCGAAHHEDCWEYQGGCSIYGCRTVARVRPGARRGVMGVVYVAPARATRSPEADVMAVLTFLSALAAWAVLIVEMFRPLR